jgi:hypothetical protein
MEVNVEDLDEFQDVEVFGPAGVLATRTRQVEKPGRFFHPLLATLITGAARLMLAIAEDLTLAEGLSWTFCDTDSMALAQPEGMADDEFLKRAERVRTWFNPLNPYEGKRELFKAEEQNRPLEGDLREDPLYCYAISDKRYVLFNLDAQGKPVIRKLSAHGLGHLKSPYDDKNAPASIPAPQIDLRDMRVQRWHHDFWYRILESVLEGRSAPTLRDLPEFNKPAASRYAATTPEALRWFADYNFDRPYREQVRPFGFLLSFPTWKRALAQDVGSSSQSTSDEPADFLAELKAVAPFDDDPESAAASCFDRETGAAIPRRYLKSYAEALNQYHENPEDKFENGDYRDRGETRRRHILATGIDYIGKEANRWEDLDADGAVEYETPAEQNAASLEALRAAAKALGVCEMAETTGFSPATMSAFCSGRATPGRIGQERIRKGVLDLSKQMKGRVAEYEGLRQRLLAAAERVSTRELARLSHVDSANLRKALRGDRQLSPECQARLKVILEDLERTEKDS